MGTKTVLYCSLLVLLARLLGTSGHALGKTKGRCAAFGFHSPVGLLPDDAGVPKGIRTPVLTVKG